MSIELRRTSPILSQVRAFAELLGDALALAYSWRERSRQRQALLRLDDRLLRDIGLTRADVEGEASKRFWRG
jgi:uncharacterized protein YjiS (DUF1127 family)